MGYAYQVWLQLAYNVQMRCRKCEKLTDDVRSSDDLIKKSIYWVDWMTYKIYPYFGLRVAMGR